MWLLLLVEAYALCSQPTHSVERRAVFNPDFSPYKWPTVNGKIIVSYTLTNFISTPTTYRDLLLSRLEHAHNTLPVEYQLVDLNTYTSGPYLDFMYDRDYQTLNHNPVDCTAPQGHIAGFYATANPPGRQRIININLCLASNPGVHLTDGTVAHVSMYSVVSFPPFKLY